MSSYSSYSNYERCPYSAQLKEAGFKQAYSFLLDSGVKSHEFGQRYGTHLKKTGKICDLEWFKKEASALRLKYDSELYKDVQWAISQFKDHIFVKDSKNRHFELEFCYDHDMNLIEWVTDGSHFFRGKMDDVTFIPSKNEAIVDDYKTGMGRNMNPRQLTWYAAVLMDFYKDLKKISTRWFFTRNTASSPAQYIDGPVIYREDFNRIFDDLKERISEFHREVKSGKELEANPGDACTWCGYTEHCKHYKNCLEAKTHTNLKEAYARKVVHEMEYKKLDKMLKAKINIAGPIDVGNGNFYCNVGSKSLALKKEFKKETFKILNTIAKESKCDIGQVINKLELSNSQLKKVISGLEDNELINKLTFIKTGNSYKLADKKPEPIL